MGQSALDKRKENAERIAQLQVEANDLSTESRAKVREILDIMSEDPDLDVGELLRHYKRCCSNPILSLAQDMQRQAMILQNIVEEIKRCSNPFDDAGEEAARTLKLKYESLDLIAKNIIPTPNPHLGKVARWALDKLANLGTGLIKLLADHGKQLLSELNFEIGTTATLQVQTGMSWTLTVGVEQTAGVTRERSTAS